MLNLWLLAAIGLFGAMPYDSIPDIVHPTWSDYRTIQKYLKKGPRPELRLLQQAIEPGGALHDYNCRARRVQLVGKWPWQRAQFGIKVFGCSASDKKICVVSYASYNQNYPKGIELLAQSLQKVGFKGHFVYRIGGWPDLEGGSLTLAHVPYAFKPCFLKELQRLGYECVLWLDSSIRPMKNLDSVFQAIEEQGYFFYPAGHSLAQYCTQATMQALNEPVEHAREIHSVLAGVFGVNLAHPSGRQLMEKWYDAARRQVPFYSPRPEQNVLSILVHQLGLNQWATTGFSCNSYNETTQFFVDAKSVQ